VPTTNAQKLEEERPAGRRGCFADRGDSPTKPACRGAEQEISAKFISNVANNCSLLLRAFKESAGKLGASQ